jgi:hypothetical protein
MEPERLLLIVEMIFPPSEPAARTAAKSEIHICNNENL